MNLLDTDTDAETNRLLAIARRGVATYDLRRDYARLNGQQAAESVAEEYPVNVMATNSGIQIELAEVDG